MNTPTRGASTTDDKKPTENAAAVTPRCQPNSSRICGNRSENEVLTLTAIAIVTKATAITTQP